MLVMLTFLDIGHISKLLKNEKKKKKDNCLLYVLPFLGDLRFWGESIRCNHLFFLKASNSDNYRIRGNNRYLAI